MNTNKRVVRKKKPLTDRKVAKQEKYISPGDDFVYVEIEDKKYKLPKPKFSNPEYELEAIRMSAYSSETPDDVTLNSIHRDLFIEVRKSDREMFVRMQLSKFIPLTENDDASYNTPTAHSDDFSDDDIKSLSENDFPDNSSSSSSSISVIIYKVGEESSPVFESDYRVESMQVSFNTFLSPALKELDEGEYIMFIGNVYSYSFSSESGYAAFPFAMLYHGKYLINPPIVDIDLKLDINFSDEAPKTYSQLQLSITTSEEECSELDNFHAICYTEGYALVGEGVGYMPNCTKTDIFLETIRFWEPGKYFVVLLHNAEPYTSIDFEISSDGVITKGDILKIGTSHDRFILTSELNTKTAWFKELLHIPGANSIRHKVVNMYRDVMFNKLRQQHGFLPLKSNFNTVIISSGDEKVDTRIAQNLCEIFADRSCIFADAADLLVPLNPSDPYSKINSVFESDIIAISKVSALLGSESAYLVKNVVDSLKMDKLILFVGNRSEVEQVFAAFPNIREYFPADCEMKLETPTLADWILWIERRILLHDFVYDKDVRQRLYLSLKGSRQVLADKSFTEIHEYVDSWIHNTVQKRILDYPSGSFASSPYLLRCIDAEDFNSFHITGQKLLFEKELEKLNSLIGLNDLKKQLTNHFMQLRLQDRRIELGLPVHKADSYHMIFTGNPGTGKTTVAKMLGKIYKSLGILSKGEVVVSERSQIVGRFIGDTEKNMLSLIERSQGNILFIDEAYTLYSQDAEKRDFGHRAIETLLTVLSAKNPDMIVIFAGYEKELNKMMNANQGLSGRFPLKLRFPDYSADELFLIGKSVLDEEHYILEPEAEKAFREVIRKKMLQDDPSFSNARWVRGFIMHDILDACATRTALSPDITDAAFLSTITVADINAAEKSVFENDEILRLKSRQAGFGSHAYKL